MLVKDSSYLQLKDMYEGIVITNYPDYEFLIMNKNIHATDKGGSVWDYYHELIIEDINSNKSFKVLVDKSII